MFADRQPERNLIHLRDMLFTWHLTEDDKQIRMWFMNRRKNRMLYIYECAVCGHIVYQKIMIFSNDTVLNLPTMSSEYKVCVHATTLPCYPQLLPTSAKFYRYIISPVNQHIKIWKDENKMKLRFLCFNGHLISYVKMFVFVSENMNCYCWGTWSNNLFIISALYKSIFLYKLILGSKDWDNYNFLKQKDGLFL